MDLSAFKEARDAVKRIVREYKPIADLSDALDQVQKLLSDLGDLDAKKAELAAVTSRLSDEQAAAEAKIVETRAAAQLEHETVAQNLSVLKNETLALQDEAKRARLAMEAYKSEMTRLAKLFSKGL